MSEGQLIEDLIRLRDKLTSQADRDLLAETINRLEVVLQPAPAPDTPPTGGAR